MKRCHVPGCSNTTLHPGISLFKVPKHAKRARQWLDAIKLKPKRSILVCEAHFAAGDIQPFEMRKRLSMGAVPSLRLPPAAAPDVVVVKEETPSLRSPSHDIPDFNNLPHQSHRSQPPAEIDPKELATLIALGQTYLTPELAKCIEIQTMLTREKKAIAESNLSDENFLFQALKLRFTFPQTYKVMWKPLGLPSPPALRRLFRPLTWEVNEEWARGLRARFAGAAPAARECAVCVARAVLRPALGYDAVRDRLRGLDELDGAQRPRVARRGLSVWARGVNSPWAQPLACCLLGDGTDLQELWLWIDIIISKLFDIGLKVRAVVTDYDDGDIDKARPVSQQRPFFTVNKRLIYRLYNCNQLIVAFRDCLIQRDISFGGNIASWNDIVSLFEHDSSNTVKLAPGLSAAHVRPQRPQRARPARAELARDVMAAPVAGALAIAVERTVLPRAALGTAQLLNSMSLLLEILSKKSLATKVLMHGATVISEKNDLSLLKDMQTLLEDMSVADETSRPARVLAALRGHVRAVRALAERACRSGHGALPLRAFDTEPLHSFHDYARRDRRPTSKRFLEGFRKSFVSNVMKPVNTASTAREDCGSFLTMAGSMRGVSSQERARPAPARPVAGARLRPLLERRGPPLARRLLAQCLAEHPACAPAREFCERAPAPPSLRSLLGQLERHFLAQAAAEGPTGLRPLLLRAAEVTFAPPCPCFPVDFLKTLYMSFRLRSLIEHNNADFKNKERRPEYSVKTVRIDELDDTAMTT